METDVYDKAINSVVVAEETKQRQNRQPSGKISASMMGKPTLWNVLKLIGVPSKPYDAYLLRKFARGNQAEDWFVSNLVKSQPFTYTTQLQVSYRGGVGYVDLAEQKGTHIKPHEVKSVTNIKYKRLTKGFVRKSIEATGVDLHHALQAAYYGLALDAPDFTIHYIASDDLRVASFELLTAHYKRQIDEEISAIEFYLQQGSLPEFIPVADWQNTKTYWDYPDMHDMTPLQMEEYIKERYPEAYDSLKTKQAYDRLKKGNHEYQTS